MNFSFSSLKRSALFNGISEGELKPLLACLAPVFSRYQKGASVLLPGETPTRFGILLSGEVRIVKEDYFGNRCILSSVGPGDLFAETFVFSEAKALPVGVVAAADSEALFIDGHRVVSPCKNTCAYHSRLIFNLLSIVSVKNVELTEKIEHTSRKTTREKLLSYLSAQAEKAGSSAFTIPFDRQALADYLGVERSAMSAELGRLRDEGVLSFHKNAFELKKN